MITVEGSLVLPECPGDAGHLVCQCDRRAIPVSFVRSHQRPGLQPSERLPGLTPPLRGQECGARTVDEEHAEISVSLLAHPA